MERGIIVVPSLGEYKIFYNPNLYHLDNEELSQRSLASVIAGTTIGYSIANADYGIIECRYNPTYQNLLPATQEVTRLIQYIESCAITES